MRPATSVGVQARVSATPTRGVALSTLIDSDTSGPVRIPATDRMIWWTGRVANGLGHRAHCRIDPSEQPSAALHS